MRLALYQPDIPQNAGAMARLAACLGVGLDIIEPCGFLFGDRQMRRAGLDYLDRAQIARHPSWPAFRAQVAPPARLIVLTTRSAELYPAFTFAADDVLLLGRETAGVPEEVHAAADARLRVPMRPGMRSLNVALAAAMVLGEALRQTDGFAETLRWPTSRRAAPANAPGGD
jgi:tRNA (cytidine/uridine-2'-O-)-methyltransferase